MQDASSNIYQHISLLLRDKELAQLVNVLESDRPDDIYQRVADEIKDEDSKSGSSALEALSKMDGLTFEASREILSGIATRKHSKSPVMTKGYGSGKRALEDMLLTHNGKPGNKKGGGGGHPVSSDGSTPEEGEQEEYVQEFETIAKEACSRIGEISDSLPEILNTTSVNSSTRHPDRGVFHNHAKWRKAAQRQCLALSAPRAK